MSGGTALCCSAGPRTAPGSPCLSCGGFLAALFSPLLEGEGLVPLPQPLRFGVRVFETGQTMLVLFWLCPALPQTCLQVLSRSAWAPREDGTHSVPLPNLCCSSLVISWKPLGCLGAPGRAQPQHRAAVGHSPCWCIAVAWLLSPAASHLPPNPLPHAQEWVRAPPAVPAPYRPFLHPIWCPAVQHGHLPCLILIISATGQP